MRHDDHPPVSVERSAVLPAHPEQVWEHVTDGDLVGDWMEGEVEIEAKPGGRIRLRRQGEPEVWGTVEEVVPHRRIQWSWRTDDGLPTLVEIEIRPNRSGTVLTVTETLLPWEVGGLPPLWSGPSLPEARLHPGVSAAA